VPDYLAHPVIQCPYCWEELTVEVDLSVGAQTYIEDCQVCCQPMKISYSATDSELVSISAEQENA